MSLILCFWRVKNGLFLCLWDKISIFSFICHLRSYIMFVYLWWHATPFFSLLISFYLRIVLYIVFLQKKISFSRDTAPLYWGRQSFFRKYSFFSKGFSGVEETIAKFILYLNFLCKKWAIYIYIFPPCHSSVLLGIFSDLTDQTFMKGRKRIGFNFKCVLPKTKQFRDISVLFHS